MILFSTICIFTATLLSRPMIFGYSVGPISLAFSVLAAVSAFLFSNKQKLRQGDAAGLLVVLLMGYIYSGILLESSIEQAIANFGIITSFTLATFLVSGLHRERFLNYLKHILRMVVISGLITGVYFYVSGESGFSDTWVWLSIATERTDIPIAHIRLPFSTIFSDLTSDLFVGSRSSFLAIEPGVAPAVLVLWRCLEEKDGRRQLIRDAVFVIAMGLSLSTTAPLSLGLYFFARSLFSRSKTPVYVRILLGVTLALAFVFVFLYTPYFGYYAKSETHFSSFETRLSWFTDESSALIQISSLVLCSAVFLVLKPWLTRDAALIAPTFLLVSALNVLEFSPLFILGVFVSIRRPATKPYVSKYFQTFDQLTSKPQAKSL